MTFDKDFFRRRIASSLPAGGAVPAAMQPPAEDAGSQPRTTIEISHLLALPTADDFLHQAYKVILGRDCDASAFVHFRSLLRQGTSRQEIIEHLCRSDEARQRNVHFVYNHRRASYVARRWNAFWASLRTFASNVLRKSAASVARLLFWQLQVVEDKLDFLLRADEDRTALLANKLDNSLWLLSEKVDANTQDVKSRLCALEELAGITSSRLSSFHDRLDSVSRQLTGIDNQLGSMVTCTEVDGFIVGVPSAEWRVIAYHSRRGNMEPGLTSHFRSLLREGMTVVDAGANLGLYTLHAAQIVGTAGRVHSIEPAPLTFDLLRDNIQVNGLLESGIVQTHQVALSNVIGEASFAIYNHKSGHNTLYPDAPADRLVQVPVMTLDALLKHVPHVDLVKIDVEGAEALVFAGMTELIARNPSICILMEFSPSQLTRAGTNPAAFLKHLADANWEIDAINAETGAPVRLPVEQLLGLWTCNLRLRRP